MTHARIAELLGEATPSRVRPPELCRLTVLAHHTQVDLAVPADVPVALLVPGIVDMIRAHGNTNDFDDAPDQHEPEEWVLARMGEPPLSSTSSLREHGVRDGELLMLESAEATAPPPLYDDIMYSVATADDARYHRWTPTTARLLGSIFAAVSVLVGCFALLWPGGQDVVGGVCALFVALLFLIAGTVVARVYGDRASAVVLGGCALPTSFTAGVLFVPGGPSAAHLLLGTVLAGACAVLAMRVSGVGVALFTAVATGAVLVVPGTVVALSTDQPDRAVLAGTAGLALLCLAFAPRIAMLLANLPLPNVPAPGTTADPDEDAGTPLPSFAELGAMAERARLHLTGLIVAATVVTAGAALAAAGADVNRWQATVLALLCAAVLMFRGRTYASAEQAIVLLAGGAIMLLTLLIGAVVTTGATLAVFGAAILLAVVALALGVLAPNHTFSPPLRRAIELFEYACVAAILPLIVWVADLYSLVRGL